MKVTFVVLGSEQLAISQLSAIAKRDGHTVGLAFSASLFHDRFNLEIPSLAKVFDDKTAMLDAIRRQAPDVLAFSCITATYQWMLEVAREAKDMFPDVKTVFGGVHVSAVPDRVIAKPEVDYVVVGEGDVAFPRILDAIAKGGPKEPIPNTRFKTPDGSVIRGLQQGFIQDLDALPHYDKMIWEDHIRVGDLYLTLATRGCPYTCSFCFNNFFSRLPEEKRGKYVRQRSVDHVMHELKWAKKRYNIKCVDFQDDVFTVSKSWIKEFTQRYKKEINLPFQCLIHPQYFDDDIARWMRDAGCVWIQMGIQTMDEKFKHENLRRYEDSDHIVKGLEAMERYGMKAKVDHMLGLPGEPIGSQATALKLYSEHTPKRIQTFWTCFLPGTDLMKQGVEQGLVTPEQAERLNEGEDFYFFRNEDNISNPELVKAYQNYEMIYKLLPVLPAFIKKKIQPHHVGWVPKTIARLIAVLLDLYIGFRNNNPEFAAYANHYLFHMSAFVRRKMGLKPAKAVKPKEDILPTAYQAPTPAHEAKSAA
jgi:radical SAM superfamily enzyme YgiQ (UPF0313 family)